MRIIFGLSAIFLMSQAATASQGEWYFRVLLDDMEIGHHRFLVTKRGAYEQVISEASYDVRLLFIPVYRYRHSSLETWKDNCLVEIQSQTDDNGNQQFINGSFQARMLHLTTKQGETRLQGCVKTFAYWDPAILKASRLLNTQTGQYTTVDTRFIANETLMINGKKVASRHYQLLMEKFTIDLWYARNDNRWLRLESTTQSGASIKYELQEAGERS